MDGPAAAIDALTSRLAPSTRSSRTFVDVDADDRQSDPRTFIYTEKGVSSASTCDARLFRALGFVQCKLYPSLFVSCIRR